MKKAQALVEILIAVGVAVIALLSISRISSRSVYNTGSASRQSAATNLASTAINTVKRMIYDQVGTQGTAAVKTNPLYVLPSQTWCFNGGDLNTTNGTDYCSIAGTDFEGKVNIANVTINSKVELTITSEIRWTEGNLTRTVKNEGKIVLDQ